VPAAVLTTIANPTISTSGASSNLHLSSTTGNVAIGGTAYATSGLVVGSTGLANHVVITDSNTNPTIGASAGCLYFNTGMAQRVAINSAATLTITDAHYTIIQNTAASVYTLPSAASYLGRILMVITHFAGTVTSASSNVRSITGGAAGTAILAATAGKWAILQSDGTDWQTIAAN